jgi:purine-cytosine permease-like protein
MDLENGEKIPQKEKLSSVETPEEISHHGIVSDIHADYHIKGTDWLSHKLKKYGVNVEDRGIERVPPENRPHRHVFDLMLLWGSANIALTTFSIGLLGTAVFGLGLTDCCLTVLFFVGFSSAAVGYLATFGPKTGLRQMTVSRYSFGWWGNKAMAVLQCASCVGWSAVNAVVGGQTLAVLSNNKLPTPAGIVIIAACTWFVAMVGYKWVHLYERYQWIPVSIVFFILLGEGVHQGFTSTPMGSGSVEAGNVLSFVYPDLK